MRVTLLILSLALLGACSNELSPEEQAAEDARKVAEVERANATGPSPEPLDPEVIGFPEMDRYGISGASCAFAPAGGGLGAIYLAMAEASYLKLDGSVLQLAPDVGSAELPFGGREVATGETLSARLTVEAEGEQSGDEVFTHPAQLTLRDANERVVYQADGEAQCGA